VYDRGISEAQAEDVEGLYRTIVDYRIGDVWMPWVDRTEALATEIDHFVDCVRNGVEPIAGGAQGRDVVRLLEATSASLAAGGQAIPLTEAVGT
jgi:predicted dehydrogenase